QGGDGIGNAGDGDHLEAAGHRPEDGVAVAGGGEEPAGAVPGGAGHLLLDAADRPDLPGEVHGAGPGDQLTTGQGARGEHVDDPQREHQPCAGAADVLDREVDVDGEVDLG